MAKVVVNYVGEFVLSESQTETLKAALPNFEFVVVHGKEFQAELLADAEVFIGNPTDAMLVAMPKLRWIQLHSAGINQYVHNPHLRDSVVVTNSSGVFGVPGAEQAIALVMAFVRQIHVHIRQQDQMIWKKNDHCLEVQDSTALVLGLGDIGSEIARRMKGLGAYVIGVKRSVPDGELPEYVDELVTVDQVDQEIGRADFVLSSLPLTEETQHFLSRERIARMKQGAVFVNVGRGATVDEAALIEALRDGRLEGAGLDVTEVEPLPQSSPLWSLPNVIITSHSVNTSPRKADRRTVLFSRNLSRYAQGQQLENRVNLKAGY